MNHHLACVIQRCPFSPESSVAPEAQIPIVPILPEGVARENGGRIDGKSGKSGDGSPPHPWILGGLPDPGRDLLLVQFVRLLQVQGLSLRSGPAGRLGIEILIDHER